MTYLKNTATLNYHRDRCIGCGLCLDVCPHGVFAMENKKAKILDRDRCMECGACVINCPAEALEVKKGVGCAYAVIISKLRGWEEVTCDCGGDDADDCCGGGGGCC